MPGQTLTRYDITDLNNGKIAEYPVENPPGWDAISLYYAKALQEMGWNESGSTEDPSAPRPSGSGQPPQGMPPVTSRWNYSERPDSYFFWAGMHWYPGHKWEFWRKIADPPQRAYWNHCTHGPASVEKYFLPWHRAYIYFYEIIIRAKVASLGGPEDWALPFWNYSFQDDQVPDPPFPRSNLPWVFAQPKLPDGTGNPLFVNDIKKRGLQPVWPAGSQAGKPMYLEPTTPPYADAYGNAIYQDPNSDADGFNPTLDGVPHGMVHVDTGTGDQRISSTGWMAYTQTAGFDPIFWLHHSQIDRLWVGWNALGGLNPNEQDPPDDAWLTAADDKDLKFRWNFWADGNIDHVFQVYPGDMLDPSNLQGPHFPYSYVYDNLPPGPGPQHAGRALVAEAVPHLERAGVPTADNALPAAPVARELGANEEGVEVRHEPATAKVSLPDDAPKALEGFDADTEAEPPRVMLYLEDIVAEAPVGNYLVYLNNPDVDRGTGGEVPHFVGALSAFGGDHVHGEDEEHHGLSASYDITDLVAYLRSKGEWNENDVSVTIVPAAQPDEELELVIGPVRVGRISIHTS